MVTCAGRTLGDWDDHMKKVLAGLVFGVGLIPVAGHAETVKEAIIQELAAEGYTKITVSRTLLGRLRFVAEGANGSREVVVQPSNGAILRDHSDDDDDDRRESAGDRDWSGGSDDSDDRESDRDDDRDDDRDSDRDDDRDDDRGGDRDSDRDDDKDDKDDRDDDRGGGRDNDKDDRDNDRDDD